MGQIPGEAGGQVYIVQRSLATVSVRPTLERMARV